MNKTKLSIEKALELARLLHPFIPEKAEDDEGVLDFIGKIVHKIKTSHTPEVFADCLVLAYDYADEDLAKLDGVDAIEKFVNVLEENRIISLCEFYQWLMK